MRGIRPPARTSSLIVLGFKSKWLITVPSRSTVPAWGRIVITSPVFSWLTSHSIGSAPESSAVLKKIGAILPPRITPPARLFGTWGMSLPVCQRTELIALFRELPVPTTSPTYATGWPFSFSFAMVLSPLGSLVSSIARACRGMSGRVVAWVAGERSSVLVSPSTLNTVTVIDSASSALVVNHSAAAQLSTTCLAKRLLVAKSITSLKAS